MKHADIPRARRAVERYLRNRAGWGILLPHENPPKQEGAVLPAEEVRAGRMRVASCQPHKDVRSGIPDNPYGIPRQDWLDYITVLAIAGEKPEKGDTRPGDGIDRLLGPKIVTGIMQGWQWTNQQQARYDYVMGQVARRLQRQQDAYKQEPDAGYRVQLPRVILVEIRQEAKRHGKTVRQVTIEWLERGRSRSA